MTKSITNEDQVARIARSDLAVIYLIKLVTYTDKGAGTAGTTFYISKRACRYDYGNTGTDQFFKPWLQSISELRSAMTHVPGGGGSGVSEKTLTVVLYNTEYEGDRVANLLMDANTLQGATIEVSELLVPTIGKGPIDLTAYTGNEHTVFYRGVVGVPVVDNRSVTLECTTEFPDFDWPKILDASTAAPRDVGSRYPIPYGSSAWTVCPSYDIGWVTTTTAAISTDSVTGAIGVTDGSGFPSGSSSYLIGDEVITATKSSDTILSITARGQLGTQAFPHVGGMPISVLPDSATYIVSRYSIAALNGLYFRSPATEELVKIPTPYTFKAVDESIISGAAVSTVNFSQSQLLQLADFIATQQFSTTDPTPPAAASTVSPNDDLTQLGTNATDQSDATYETAESSADHLQKTYDITFDNNPDLISQTVRVGLGADSSLEYVRVYKGHSQSGEKILDILPDDIGAGLTWFEADGGLEDEYTLKARFLSDPGSVRIYEFERIEIEPATPAAFQVPTEIAAAQLALNMPLYANVDGVAADYGWTEGYDFDDSDTWNVDNCTTNRDTSGNYEGTASRELLVDLVPDATVIQDCESLTNWTRVEGDSGLTLVTSSPTPTEGTYAIQCGRTTSGPAAGRYTNASWGHDLSDTGSGIGLILVDVYCDADGGPWPLGRIDIYLGSNAGTPTSNYDQWQFLMGTELAWTEDEWNTVVVDWRETPDIANGFDETDLQMIGVYVGQGMGQAKTVTFDNIRIVRVPAAGGGTLEAVAQNNSLGGVDLSSDGDHYRIRAKADANVDPGALYFDIELSSSTGSGTTQQAVRRTVEFGTAQLESGTWIPLISSNSTDTGSPTMTGINTLRVVVNQASPVHGTYPGRIVVGSVNLDILEANDDDLVSFEANGGEALEKPVDVARHWIETIGGGNLDETALTTANTNLGTNILAGDARGWGLTWREVLDYLAYISRSNFVPEETASQTEWKMLCATSAYAWPAASKTLDMFRDENVYQGGRDQARDLFSGRTWVYDYRPNLGVGDEGFAGLIRIGSDQNDSGGKVSAATVTAAYANFGTREARIVLVSGIADEATMQEIAGYYYTEGARITPIISIRDLSWSQGYDLEVGDIVDMVRPWKSGTLKLRLIEAVKSFETQRIDLVGVSV